MDDVTSLSAPDAGNDQPQNGRADADSGQRKDPHRSDAGQVLEQQQCLAGLSQLPGLLALGLLKPPQANAMRGVYKDILQHYQQAERASTDRGLSDADVLDVLRDNPKLLKMMEPFLTDEQVEMVLRGTKDGVDGQQA